MKLILASAQDPAALNIAACLLELHDFEKYRTLPNAYICGNVLLVKIDHEATQITTPPFNADEVIVASRHASEAGKPSLTVHAPGELERGELAVASPPTIKSALQELASMRDEFGLPHEVSLEATHHGPTKLGVPVTFIEIGSTPDQWQNERAGEVAARAIMAAATSSTKCTNAIGFGGPHYAPRHTEVTLHTDIAVGHILPKYSSLDEKLIERAVLCTRNGARLFVLDRKGMSMEQRMLCQRVAAGLGIRTAFTGEILRGEKV
jgi:D-aminoacyl-tRNA deacylase